MDRSFLSRPEVIAASRRFVCIRLATYEDAEEAKLLASLFVGGSGAMENTTFAMLTPDGRRELVPAERSTKQAFTDAAEMAEVMKEWADEITARWASQPGTPALPKVANVRLALDIAACDLRPLVVLAARTGEALAALEERAQALAWSEAHLGRFVFATTTAPADLAAVEGAPAGGGLLVVQPDRFGLKGRVLASAPADAAEETLARTLDQGLAAHQAAAKDHHGHVREGRRLRLLWETAIPVSDPMERAARERGR